MAGSYRSPKAGRERVEITEGILKHTRLPKRYWTSSLSGILPADSNHAAVVNQYIAELPRWVDEGFGLLLYGPASHGKTAATSVVFKMAASWCYRCFFIRAADLCQAVRDKEKFNESHSVLQRARDVDVLFLDDVGKEESESLSFHHRIISEMIRHRTDEILPTFITSNLDGAKDIEKIYTASFVEVLTAHFRAVQVEGHNYRAEEAKEIGTVIPGTRGPHGN